MSEPHSSAEDPSAGRLCEARFLGTVPYAEGLDLQSELVERRRRGEVVDQLLLLEHPHVITLGTGARDSHILADEEERARMGIELFEIGRGGDVTYHGPGQLVGYPILDLKPDRKDLHRYLRELEEVLIRTLSHYGIESSREEGLTGVWVPQGKIAAIGVRVSSGWITSHGFALNVAPDLRYFDTIVPCGLHDKPVASLAGLLGRQISPQEVVGTLTKAFEEVFQRSVRVG